MEEGEKETFIHSHSLKPVPLLFPEPIFGTGIDQQNSCVLFWSLKDCQVYIIFFTHLGIDILIWIWFYNRLMSKEMQIKSWNGGKILDSQENYRLGIECLLGR